MAEFGLRFLKGPWATAALVCLAAFVILFALSRSNRQRPVRLCRVEMKRSASLDFLRGAAAFAVAIPHYLTRQRAVSAVRRNRSRIAGVEVFFVLSGFVLAPQIVDWVVGKPWRNLGVFLMRRWMRTIPPYVVALVAIALLTGNLMTADFVRYLFYVENLFSPAANPRRFLSRRMESGSRRMVLCSVRSRPLSLSRGCSDEAIGASSLPLRS